MSISISSAPPIITRIIVNELFDNFIAANYSVTWDLVNWSRFYHGGELRSKYPYLSQMDLARLIHVPEEEIQYMQELQEYGLYRDSEKDPIPWKKRMKRLESCYGYKEVREFLKSSLNK